MTLAAALGRRGRFKFRPCLTLAFRTSAGGTEIWRTARTAAPPLKQPCSALPCQVPLARRASQASPVRHSNSPKPLDAPLSLLTSAASRRRRGLSRGRAGCAARGILVCHRHGESGCELRVLIRSVAEGGGQGAGASTHCKMERETRHTNLAYPVARTRQTSQR